MAELVSGDQRHAGQGVRARGLRPGPGDAVRYRPRRCVVIPDADDRRQACTVTK